MLKSASLLYLELRPTYLHVFVYIRHYNMQHSYSLPTTSIENNGWSLNGRSLNHIQSLDYTGNNRVSWDHFVDPLLFFARYLWYCRTYSRDPRIAGALFLLCVLSIYSAREARRHRETARLGERRAGNLRLAASFCF